MRTFIIMIVSALVCACSSGQSSVDGSTHEPEKNNGSSLSGGGEMNIGKGGAGGVYMPCKNPDPNPCEWDCEKNGEKPLGCACDAECPFPADGNCDAPFCNKSHCDFKHLSEGDSCFVVMGECEIHGECLSPIGVCDNPPFSAPIYCKSIADCDDKNDCTLEADCVSGMCIRKPQLDGTICGVEKACNRGACCNWPKGTCDPLNYPCGLDPNGNGGLPIGTPCELNSGKEGLCGFYQCCIP